MTDNEFAGAPSRIPPQLLESMLHGKGAADIGWGRPGDFASCRRFLAEHGVPEKFWDGECATVHHLATGEWPGKNAHKGHLAADGAPHAGAMIALIPQEADGHRFAIKDGEPPEELHVTMAYLGDAAGWPVDSRLAIASQVADNIRGMGPIAGQAFASAHFNPGGDEPAMVYGIGGGGVNMAHHLISGATYAFADQQLIPPQKTPFAGHMTAAYSSDPGMHAQLHDQMGPIIFDRVRVAFGDTHYDIPLRDEAPVGYDDATLTAAGAVTDPNRVYWRGPLAPLGAPTGDGRVFNPDGMIWRNGNLALNWQEHAQRGHDDGVTVGGIERVWIQNQFIWGEGFFLNADIIPEVSRALEVVRNGVSGPSVDLDLFAMHDLPGGLRAVDHGRISRVTLVSLPAFANLRLELSEGSPLSTPDEMPLIPDPAPMVAPYADEKAFYGFDLEAQDGAEFTINPNGWKGLPVAPRSSDFNADEAYLRIAEHAGIGTDTADPKIMSKLYLWEFDDQPLGSKARYRLPVADIVDGKPHMYYHAIYSAAALLNGGHGGLPNIPGPAKDRLKSIITDIYAHLATELGDPNIKAPWEASAMDVAEFAVRTSGWADMPIGSGSWDKGAALRALDSWAGDDMGKYAKAFLWKDGDGTEKGDYKFPIARPVNGHLEIIPAAVNNAKARLSSANGVDQSALESTINAIQKRFQAAESSLIASGAPVRPSKSAYANPKLKRPTKPTVRDDYTVFGHLAQWGVCHLSVQNKCTMAPRSRRQYADFHNGTTVVQGGDSLDTGTLFWDGTHAKGHLTAAGAMTHYENTTSQVATVTVGEDEFGIWFAGSLLPGADEAEAQKFRRSPLSGDWRRVAGHLELVAALSVNTPGFGIRPEYYSLDGEMMSLTAAGMLVDDQVMEPVEADADVLMASGIVPPTAEELEFLLGLARDKRAFDLAALQGDCGCKGNA